MRRSTLACSLGVALAGCALLLASTSPGPSAEANPLDGVGEVAAGNVHTCALTDEGGVICWGDNTYGRLGDGTTTMRAKPAVVPALETGVAAVAAGGNHTCAVTAGGAAKCWGRNRYGELGTGGSTGFGANPTPRDVFGLDGGVAAITAGGAHTCALLETGAVKCWGWNEPGQIGNGLACNQCLTPRDVTGLASGVTAIDAGGEHTCAVTEAGGVKCWGQNAFGQLGAATGSPCVDETLMPLACATTPVEVSGLSSGVIAIALGGQHTCALLAAGAVKCWGDNSSGQLGDGQACGMTCVTPVDVSGLSGPAVGLSAGGSHTCALLEDTTVQCWGDNALGQLGNGGSPANAPQPVDVCDDAFCAADDICPAVVGARCGILVGATASSAGGSHTCAADGDTVKCWGANAAGQLGDSQACDAICDTPIDVLTTKGAPTPAATATPTPTGAVTPTPTQRPPAGDADCDGRVTSIDAALILQYGARLLATLRCADAADVNGDGRVDAVDAALILQRVAGLLASL